MLAAAAASVTLMAAPLKPYPRTPSRAALAWADKTLASMSLDEKIGQLIGVGLNATFLNQDTDAYRALAHQVVDLHAGGVILFKGPVYESVILTNRLQTLAKTPLLISADLEAGAGMRFDDTINFPWNMAVGATGQPEYARRQGAITAREARALGVAHILAPVADVNNNPANPVINVRSYGEDPAEVARMVAAFVDGVQRGGAMATAKHFPGHGDTATDSHRGLPEIDVTRERLNSVELVPFRAAVDAGVGAVMTGHIGLPKIDPTPVAASNASAPPIDAETIDVSKGAETMPSTLSRTVNDILRRDLKFDGLIVTDALSMSGLALYFTPEESAVRALEAGADMLLKPADADAAVRGLREAVAKGRVPVARIEASARKILAAKFDLGLAAERLTPLDAIDREVSNPDAAALASEIADHAITLVRNDAGVLPLPARADGRLANIAITNGEDRLVIAQPFAAAMVKGGWPVDTIVLDARSSDADVARAIDLGARARLTVCSMYVRVRTGAANSTQMPAPGARAITGLIARKARVMAVSFGNPYALEDFPALSTYLAAYGDMPALQEAAARALLGQINITGRLPVSLPGLYPRGTGIQLMMGAR